MKLKESYKLYKKYLNKTLKFLELNYHINYMKVINLANYYFMFVRNLS